MATRVVQDPTSVFFIHPSDSSANQLVSVKFNGQGFNNWKRSMMLTLSAKNKLGFVDGTIEMPAVSDPNYKSWERCNDLVISWILFNLEENIARSVLFLKTAKAIWNDLEARFGFASVTQVFSLEQKLSEMKQGQQSVSEFYTQIRTVWDSLDDADPLPNCTCDKCTCTLSGRILKMQQDHRVLQFLMKLNDQFSMVRANILMMVPLPSLAQAYRMIAQEETHKDFYQTENQNDTLAFVADKRNFQNKSQTYNSSAGFQRQNSNFPPRKFNQNQKPANNYYCTHCKIAGHSIERCFKIHGFPPGFKGNRDRKVASLSHTDQPNVQDTQTGSAPVTMDQYNHLLELINKQTLNTSEATGVSGHALLAGKCLMSSFSDEWLLDSGATDHITNSINDFQDFKCVTDNDSHITIPDGRKIQVTHIGTVILSSDITLLNVLLVPEFKYKLISVNKLCKDMHSNLYFSDDKCYLQALSQKQPPLHLGNLEKGLYTVHSTNVKDFSTTTSANSIFDNKATYVSVSEEAKLWHLRLGHLPFDKLKHIQPTCSVKDCINSSICQICPKAKQTRLCFPDSSIKSTCIFQMLHVDIWGPYRVSNHNGCTQFVTIVDDFSRYTWIHLIKYKSEIANVLTQFVNYAEVQFKAVVKCVRSGNAKELTEGILKQFFQSKGIIHQTSCSYTPQQNGVVERKHRHLLETARSLYFQSKLPAHYWGECILCACYLINRMPLKSINNITPYQKLHKEPPILDNLRVFGCLCYVSTTKPNRSKFDPRSIPCVFLGYPPYQKAYKVLDLNTKTILISRDVIFHEHHFPYHILSHTSQKLYDSATFIPTNTSSTTQLYEDLDYIQSPPVNNPDHTGQFDSRDVNNSESSDHSDNNQSNNYSTLNSQSSPNSNSESSDSILIPQTRQSTRIRNKPSYLSSYHCNVSHLDSLSGPSHWCNLVTFDRFPSSHKAFLASTSVISEPQSYEEASQHPLWVEAMQKELKALSDNNTWDLVDLPPDKKAIGFKWVFKVKLKADGSLERCKARLVAKGFNQKFGVDYAETFSPVVKMTTLRCLLALAASRNWKLFQLDVNNAFLHGDLKEEVYMQVPQGVPHLPNQVCRLKKSLYGLKQASREWFSKLLQELVFQGYEQSKNDYSLFIKHNGSLMTIVAVYVDDIIVTGDDLQETESLKAHLDKVFSIKDLGILHYFLGLEVGYVQEGILLSQKKFASDLLKDCNLNISQPAVTPLPLHLKLTATDGCLLDDPEHYRSLVGKLNYLTNTRPDLSYVVQTLSQFLHCPRAPHLEALTHTLRYVAQSVGQGILLKASNSLTVQAFSDSDWASCPDSRRSLTGYVMLFGKDRKSVV